MLIASTILLIGLGLCVGLLIAIPVGPVNILCIQRTLERGFWGGIAAGLGAVFADGLLVAFAAFGMTAIADLMENHKIEVQLIGGLIISAFGLRLLFFHPKMTTPLGEESSLAINTGTIPQTFFLTVTNPGAILGVFAIIGGVVGSVLGRFDSYMSALILVMAVMGGSLIWWFSLSWLIATMRHHLNEKRLKIINQAAGLILLAFAIALLINVTLDVI